MASLTCTSILVFSPKLAEHMVRRFVDPLIVDLAEAAFEMIDQVVGRFEIKAFFLLCCLEPVREVFFHKFVERIILSWSRHGRVAVLCTSVATSRADATVLAPVAGGAHGR